LLRFRPGGVLQELVARRRRKGTSLPLEIHPFINSNQQFISSNFCFCAIAGYICVKTPGTHRLIAISPI